MPNRSNKSRLSPDTVRKLAIGWMVFVALAGAAVFFILLVTLNNRSQRLAAEAELTAVAVVPTLTSVPIEIEPSATLDPAAGPTVTPTPPTTIGLDGDKLELGGQVPGFIANPDVMRSAGMTWVKFQFPWSPDADPAQARQLIETGHSHGFKVLLSIPGPLYPQETIDYASYLEYLEQVAAFQPDAIEIWNEMNLDREWPAGQIDPVAYVENMLAPGYEIIKRVSPQTTVIIGALAPTGFDNGTNAWSDQRYVAGLAAAGAANYADCIGVHHNSGTTAPSARTGHVFDPGDAHYSWYYLPTVEVYYEGMNRQLPICVTEFGYLTPDGFDTPIPQNFAWGNNNTIEEQAAWLAEGVNISQDLGYVHLMIIWNVDFTNWDENDPYAGYAILRPDGTCPACSTLRQAISD